MKHSLLYIALLILALIGMTGSGYAITYTGTTTSSSRDIDAEYIEIDLKDGSGGDYDRILGSDIALNTSKVGGVRVWTLPTNTATADHKPLQQFAQVNFRVAVNSDSTFGGDTLPMYAKVSAALTDVTNGLVFYYKLDNGDWTVADGTNLTSIGDQSVTGTPKAGTGTMYLAVYADDPLTSQQVATLGAFETSVTLYTQITDSNDYRPDRITSIEVKNGPTKTTYSAGEKFDPTGLVITVTYSDSTTIDVAYAGNESLFSFTPNTSTALSDETNITIGFSGKTATQSITVNS